MFAFDSPFRNLPRQLDRRQAFFLDGMRHAAEISEISFRQLSLDLESLSRCESKRGAPDETFAKYFLNAWAFVDSVHRFVGLWKNQPQADSLPVQFSGDAINEAFRPLLNVRDVCDHLAARADQVISRGSTALGVLSWITILEDHPQKVGTYTIRPGIVGDVVNEQFNAPPGGKELRGISKSVNIQLRAGPHTANLSDSYFALVNLISYAEHALSEQFDAHQINGQSNGADMLISALLNTHRAC